MVCVLYEIVSLHPTTMQCITCSSICERNFIDGLRMALRQIYHLLSVCIFCYENHSVQYVCNSHLLCVYINVCCIHIVCTFCVYCTCLSSP